MRLFKGLKQKRRFGYMLIWLAAGISLTAYYLLAYVPEQEQALQARYFRVLDRIGKNLNNRFENYGQQAESYSHTIYANYESLYKLKGKDFDSLKFDNTGIKWNEKRTDPSSNDLLYVRIDKKTLNTDSKLQILSDSIIIRFAFLAKKKNTPQRNGNKNNFQYTITFKANKESLFQNLRRKEVFDHFLVLEQNSSEKDKYNKSHELFNVVYSTFPTPRYIEKTVYRRNNPKVAVLPAWLQDTSGIQITRSSVVHIQGKPYRLFLQPVIVNHTNTGKGTWLIAGAVPQKAFNSEAKAIPPHIIELLLTLLLLSLLGLPFLKLIMIRSIERLHKRDFIWVTIALLLGTSLYIIFSFAQFGRSKIDSGLLDYQLTALGNSVQGKFNKELQNLAIIMDSTDLNLQMLNYEFPDYENLKIQKYALASDSSDFEKHTLENHIKCKSPKIDYIMWLNNQGKPLVRWDLKKRVPFKDLSHRSYFIQAKNKPTLILPHQNDSARIKFYGYDFRTWLNNLEKPVLQCNLQIRIPFKNFLEHNYFGPPNTFTNTFAGGFYGFESIISYSGGELVGVLSKKSKCITCDTNKVAEKNKNNKLLNNGLFINQSGCDSAIQTAAATFQSFNNISLPDGYRFCLIDAKGEVLFHSEKHLNLSENILEDCEPDGAGLLHAAISAHKSETGEVRYQGELNKIKIFPLLKNEEKRTGVISPYYIVIFASQASWISRQMHASTIAVLLVIAFQLLMVLLAIILKIIETHTQTPNHLPKMALDWCWIRTTYNRHYFMLVLLGISLTILLLFSTSLQKPLQNFAFLLITVISFFLFNFLTLNSWEKGNGQSLSAYISQCKKMICICITVVILLNLFSWYYLFYKNSNDWFLEFGKFQLRLIGLFILLLLLNKWKKFKIIYKNSDRLLLKSTLRSYTLLVVVWIILLSILPAYFGYHAADRYERKLQTAWLEQSARQKESELGTDNNNYINTILNQKIEPKVENSELIFNRLMKYLHYSYQTVSHKLVFEEENKAETVLPGPKKSLCFWKIESASFFGWTIVFILDILLILFTVYYISRFAIERLMLADIIPQLRNTNVDPEIISLNFQNRITLLIHPSGSTLEKCKGVINLKNNTVPYKVALIKQNITSVKTAYSRDSIAVIEEFEHEANKIESLELKIKLLRSLLKMPFKKILLLSSANPKDFIGLLPLNNNFIPNSSASIDCETYKEIYYKLISLLKDAEIHLLPIKDENEKPQPYINNYQHIYIWQTLTIHEKCFLYDLGQDGIVNGKNPVLIEGLLKKGFIVIKNDRLLVFNESFREFIMREGKFEIMHHENYSEVESEWVNLERPVLIGIAAIAGFLFLTQRDAFNTFESLLVALTGLIPLVPRLLTAFSTSKAKANS